MQNKNNNDIYENITNISLAKKLNIRPFAAISSLSEKYAKKVGFRFRELSASLHKNKWISLTLNWSANDEFYHLFKYCKNGGTSYATDEVSFDLEFNNTPHFYYIKSNDNKYIKHRINLSLKIGLLVLKHTKYLPENLANKEKNTIIYNKNRIKYTPVFTRNLKYGVEVWFAPNNWEIYSAIKTFYLAVENENS